jgi:hypothetical protein
VSGLVQAPQFRVAPHPFETWPQLTPGSHVVDVQPHVFDVPPPPQVLGAVHVPQSRVPPHPSGIPPHVAPWALQVVGVHGVVQTPLNFLPGGETFTHSLLQQDWLVAQAWLFGLHGPACAKLATAITASAVVSRIRRSAVYVMSSSEGTEARRCTRRQSSGNACGLARHLARMA